MSSVKSPLDGDELLRFAKNTSALIRNVLEKVHRIPHRKQAKKKLKRVKKTQQKPLSPTCNHSETSNTYAMPVRETTTFDLPLEYFMHNMYEEEELSVENLLPSLTTEDFSSATEHSSQNYYAEHGDPQSY